MSRRQLQPDHISSPHYLRLMTEAQWQGLVESACDVRGWAHWHFPQMKGNPPGWADLMILRNGVWIPIELKTEAPASQLNRNQMQWHETVRAHGGNPRVFRPRDWDELEQLLSEDEHATTEVAEKAVSQRRDEADTER